MERKGSAPEMCGTQCTYFLSIVSIVLSVHCPAHKNSTFQTGGTWGDLGNACDQQSGNNVDM